LPAGADIKEMVQPGRSPTRSAQTFFAPWGKLAAVRHPDDRRRSPGTRWAGGCELAMMCDLLIAARPPRNSANPRIKLGVPAGHGAVQQRLTRAIGKAKAMDLILTGPHHRDAAEAERSGPGVAGGARPDDLLTEAKARRHHHLADVAVGVPDGQGGGQPRPSNPTLAEGLLYERRLFHFGLSATTDDQSEGMARVHRKTAPRNFTPPLKLAQQHPAAASRVA